MSLCTACIQVAQELSKVIIAGSSHEFSSKPIRHGRPFKEIRSSLIVNACPLCSLLQRNYTREDEDEPLDDTFAAEIFPSWVSGNSLASGEITTDSALGSRRLRLLYVTVRRHRHGRGKVKEILGRDQLTRPPVPLQIYAPIGKYSGEDCRRRMKLTTAYCFQNLKSPWELTSGAETGHIMLDAKRCCRCVRSGSRRAWMDTRLAIMKNWKEHTS